MIVLLEVSNDILVDRMQCLCLVSGGAGANVIQWNMPYNGWDVLLGEVQLLINQISYGAGW